MDEHIEQADFEGTLGRELGEQGAVEFGEFLLLAGRDDELFGSEAVLDGVARGAGLTGVRTGTGRQKCIGGAGSRLGW